MAVSMLYDGIPAQNNPSTCRVPAVLNAPFSLAPKRPNTFRMQPATSRYSTKVRSQSLIDREDERRARHGPRNRDAAASVQAA